MEEGHWKAAWGRWAFLRAATVPRSLRGRLGSQDIPAGTLSPSARFSSDLWGTGPKPSTRQGRAIKGGTGVATAPFGCVMEAAIKPSQCLTY